MAETTYFTRLIPSGELPSALHNVAGTLYFIVLFCEEGFAGFACMSDRAGISLPNESFEHSLLSLNAPQCLSKPGMTRRSG